MISQLHHTHEATSQFRNGEGHLSRHDWILSVSSRTLAVLFVFGCRIEKTTQEHTASSNALEETGADNTTAIDLTSSAGATTVDSPTGSAQTVPESDSASLSISTTSSANKDVQGSPLECDPFLQDCPIGQKCVPWTEDYNATKCVDVMGDIPPGAGCTAPQGAYAGVDDCADDSICWKVGPDNLGICVLLCSGTYTDPKCPPGAVCYLPSEATFGLCPAACHPLAKDCPAGEACAPQSGGWECFIDTSGDQGAFNDPCKFPGDCNPGLLCVHVAMGSSACDSQKNDGCCQPFCKIPGGACPNPDQECRPWYERPETAPPGYEDLGFCAVQK